MEPLYPNRPLEYLSQASSLACLQKLVIIGRVRDQIRSPEPRLSPSLGYPHTLMSQGSDRAARPISALWSVPIWTTDKAGEC